MVPITHKPSTGQTTESFAEHMNNDPKPGLMHRLRVTSGAKRAASRLVLAAGVLGLPFAIFYWLVPWWSDLTIGNDYVLTPIYQQLEIQYHLARGTFPLFVPGFLEGHSSAALTLAQTYHPLPHVASMMPGYWSHRPLEWNTIFRLIELGITQLCVFFFLRRLQLSIGFAFVFSLIAVYNARMLDLFRYGPSLEGYTGYLLLCSALGLFFLRETPARGPLLIVGATYLLTVSGHPQMIYLGFVGVGLFLAVLPWAVAAIDPAVELSRRRVISFYVKSLGAVLAGWLVALPYLFPLYFEFLQQNASRAEQTYEWSVRYADSWGGMLRNFVNPLGSDVHSAFGGTSLLLLALLFPVAAVVARKRPSGIVGAWALLVVVLLIALGQATPLHRLFWEYMPFAQSFRVPGRITIALPMLVVLILAWMARQGRAENAVAGSFAAAAVLALYLLDDLLPTSAAYVPAAIGQIPQWAEFVLVLLGIVMLLLYVLRFVALGSDNIRRASILAFCLCVVLGTALTLRYGTWVTQAENYSSLGEMDEQRRADIGFQGDPGNGMGLASVDRQMQRSILDPYLATFYRNATPVASLEEAYAQMATRRHGNELVVEDVLRSSMAESANGFTVDQVRLVHNTANVLAFSVHAGANGYMALGLPYLSGWRATVDEREVPVLRANGYSMAVWVEQGTHAVIFEYWSPSLNAGIVVALIVIACFGMYAGMHASRSLTLRYVYSIISILAAVGIYMTWRSSIYGGVNLGTIYSWESTSLPPRENIAFGRPTKASSQATWHIPTLDYPGRAVDGRTDGKPFVSGSQRGAGWWQVDLGQNVAVGKIDVYAQASPTIFVLTSTDGESFDTLAQLPPSSSGAVRHADLKGINARYLRLAVPSGSKLTLSEVYVFSPESGPAPSPL